MQSDESNTWRRGRLLGVGVGAVAVLAGTAIPAGADHNDPATADQFVAECQGPASKYICAGGYLTHYDAPAANRATAVFAVGCTAKYAPGNSTMTATFKGQFYLDDAGAWQRYGEADTAMGGGPVGTACSAAASGWARRYAPLSSKRIAQRWSARVHMTGSQTCVDSGCGFATATGDFWVTKGGHGA